MYAYTSLGEVFAAERPTNYNNATRAPFPLLSVSSHPPRKYGNYKLSNYGKNGWVQDRPSS